MGWRLFPGIKNMRYDKIHLLNQQVNAVKVIEGSIIKESESKWTIFFKQTWLFPMDWFDMIVPEVCQETQPREKAVRVQSLEFVNRPNACAPEIQRMKWVCEQTQCMRSRKSKNEILTIWSISSNSTAKALNKIRTSRENYSNIQWFS